MKLADPLMTHQYRHLHARRRELMASVDTRLNDCDGLVMPTVPIVAPRLFAVADPGEVGRIGALLLCNTAPWNFLDYGALTVPIASPRGTLLAHGRRVDTLVAVIPIRPGLGRPAFSFCLVRKRMNFWMHYSSGEQSFVRSVLAETVIDTDSFTGAGVEPPKAPKLGDWRLQAPTRSIEISISNLRK
ncbi:amidase family protein [Mesorhizobium sp. Root157]|uniref:amidase family protein n=1 Tax=Mesorhizobium sp. Root157 TaxID=1736477 RepID=UPI00138F1782|nr:amidase family protein [Mesorhizobium sp. Root157]